MICLQRAENCTKFLKLTKRVLDKTTLESLESFESRFKMKCFIVKLNQKFKKLNQTSNCKKKSIIEIYYLRTLPCGW